MAIHNIERGDRCRDTRMEDAHSKQNHMPHNTHEHAKGLLFELGFEATILTLSSRHQESQKLLPRLLPIAVRCIPSYIGLNWVV